jgi:hypothetical protein
MFVIPNLAHYTVSKLGMDCYGPDDPKTDYLIAHDIV